MIWLDSVLATPALGIRLKPNYDEIDNFKKNLSSFISSLVKNGKNINVNQHDKDIWGYKINAQDYFFELSHKNIFIKYSYFSELKREAGAFPAYNLPELKSYSLLLSDMLNCLEEILKCIEKNRLFEFDRIGIVSNIDLDQNAIPPGMNDLIQHLGRPWENKIETINSMILAELGRDENDEFYDRCHHHIKFVKETIDETGYSFILDWQRLFSKPLPVKCKSVLEKFEMCKEAAFQYFETLGEGDLSL